MHRAVGNKNDGLRSPVDLSEGTMEKNSRPLCVTRGKSVLHYLVLLSSSFSGSEPSNLAKLSCFAILQTPVLPQSTTAIYTTLSKALMAIPGTFTILLLVVFPLLLSSDDRPIISAQVTALPSSAEDCKWTDLGFDARPSPVHRCLLLELAS